MHRRTFQAGCLAAALSLAAAAPAAFGQSRYPERPVRMVVPAPPGSGPDALGRMIGQRLAESWGQPVVIDNVIGASGIIGHEKGAKAPPDGYTLVMGLIGPMSVSSSLSTKLPYDPVKDFAPVTLLVKLANVLVVNPKVPVKSLGELLTYARQHPEQIRYGYPGAGTSLHLAAEQLNLMAGIKTTGVPYKTSAQMTTDVIGGHIDMVFHNAPVVLPHIRAGSLRALAISSAVRDPANPDIPTLAEAGVPGYEVTSWYAMYVPAATPKPIVDKLNADIARVLAQPEVKEWMATQAGVAGGGSPEDLAAFQHAETEKWKKLVKAANIRAD